MKWLKGIKQGIESRETKGITAVMMIEIIGKPPEHLIETLKEIIKKIDDEPRVSVKEQKIGEPNLMKDQKDFYMSFAEIEVEVEEILDLAILMFKYMPAHIEIVSPELIALTNNGWNDIFNELVRRLHGYDEIARVLSIEKNILEQKLRQALGQGQQIGTQGQQIGQQIGERAKQQIVKKQIKEKPKKIVERKTVKSKK